MCNWFIHNWNKWADVSPVVKTGTFNFQLKECEDCGIKKLRVYYA